MIWFKSILIGLAAAIATIIMIVLLVLATAMWWIDAGTGAGIIGVWFGVSELLLVPVILAFALGFWWSVRRQRRKHILPGA